YLKEHATLVTLQIGLENWFEHYNDWRPHQALENLTPKMSADYRYKRHRRTL
ncbi:MAG TPA: hypothetical protein EYQ50_17310, partial [Verrucomicrobiales bacterium]|nr:hypothetical protein [Verrucomicrobiales bacterium]